MKVHGFRGLCRTDNPQSLATVAKTPEEPMFPRGKRMLTIFSLRYTSAPLRMLECRPMSARGPTLQQRGIARVILLVLTAQ